MKTCWSKHFHAFSLLGSVWSVKNTVCARKESIILQGWIDSNSSHLYVLSHMLLKCWRSWKLYLTFDTLINLLNLLGNPFVLMFHEVTIQLVLKRKNIRGGKNQLKISEGAFHLPVTQTHPHTLYKINCLLVHGTIGEIVNLQHGRRFSDTQDISVPLGCELPYAESNLPESKEMLSQL